MATILLNQRNIVVQMIEVEDPPHPTDLKRVPPHHKKEQILSNTPSVIVAIVPITAAVVIVFPPVSKTKGEGKCREDRLHRRLGGVTGNSKETLKKIAKTNFGMTEVHAVTARGCLMQGEVAPAACKLVLPRSLSHGQCECYFCVN